MTRLSARCAWRPSLTVCLSGVATQFHGLPEGLYKRLDRVEAHPAVVFCVSRWRRGGSNP